LDHANAKYKADREAVTKKYGFKDFAEYEAVAKNISMVVTAIDPQTKVYTVSQTAIKKEIEDVSTDKAIPNREKNRRGYSVWRRREFLALREEQPGRHGDRSELRLWPVAR
jgi:translation elongation factor EF-Ts